MKRSNPISEDLIAPCGMNCAVCSRYLSYIHDLKRSRCAGCRPGNTRCTYLFEKCKGMNHAAEGDAVFCFACADYPCAQIDRMDDRYRKNFNMSIKENLAFIKKKGLARFIQAQYRKYRCPNCNGLISMHNGKCFHCSTITKLVDISEEGKRSRRKIVK